jgi:tRNA G10  N-methylase Trm11
VKSPAKIKMPSSDADFIIVPLLLMTNMGIEEIARRELIEAATCGRSGLLYTAPLLSSSTVDTRPVVAADCAWLMRLRPEDVTATPWGVRGLVRVNLRMQRQQDGVPLPLARIRNAAQPLMRLRTIHHVTWYHGRVELPPRPTKQSSSSTTDADAVAVAAESSEVAAGGADDSKQSQQAVLPSSSSSSDPVDTVIESDAAVGGAKHSVYDSMLTDVCLRLGYHSDGSTVAVDADECDDLICVPSMRGADSFRVVSDVCGYDGMHYMDVQRRAGEALHERYEVPGRMKGAANLVRVDVIGCNVIIHTQLNTEMLSIRYRNKLFVQSITIRANVACAMLRAAHVTPGERILDPFCGSGTILLEAVSMLNGAVECVGTDCSQRSLNGAKKLADIVGETAASRITYEQLDARNLHRHFPAASFDAIVTNPPWGNNTIDGLGKKKHAQLMAKGAKKAADAGKEVHAGNASLTKEALEDIYRRFLFGAWKVLKPRGRLVIFVLHGLMTVELVRKHQQFEVLDARVVKTTNNLPSMIVLEKRCEADVQHEFLQRQLYDFGNFVNLNRATFLTVHNKKKFGAVDE